MNPGVDRLVGTAHADLVRRDDPVTRIREHRYHFAVEVGPAGLAVQHQDYLTIGGPGIKRREDGPMVVPQTTKTLSFAPLT